jgi:hypothetical protein
MVKHKEEINEQEARELQLSAENDADLYRQRLMPIYKNLARKKLRKIYKHALAVKLMRYAVDEANKKYKKDFGYSFNTATRNKVAEDMTRNFEDEYKSGERFNAYKKLPEHTKKFLK